MNDRIRELYQQAHSIRYHDGDPMRDGNPPTVYWQGEKSAEKFAELIVRECADWTNENVGLITPEARQDLYKHFGVKE
jgi:hypothetical protein